MPIICASRSTAPSAARSAMSSPCRCAEAIIARSIAVAMKPHGGKMLAIDPTITARGLWLETHPLPTRPDEMGIAGATSAAPINAKRDRSLRNEAGITKRSQLSRLGPNDFLQTD